MKIINKILILILFSFVTVAELTFILSKDELKVALDVAKHLNVHNCILYIENDTISERQSLENFKAFSLNNLFTKVIRNHISLYKSFLKDFIPDNWIPGLISIPDDLMIILKTDNISLIKRMTEYSKSSFEQKVSSRR